jgi:broad specificity phosphatase PhoE
LGEGSGCEPYSLPLSKRTTLYLIRHAESEWNAAYNELDHSKPEWFTFLMNPFPILTKRDHPITAEGARQCVLLGRVIRAAAARGDADACAMLAPQAVLASSPLTRAVATALLTFSAHRDHIHPAGKLKPVVVVPTARESDAHWFFGRDSLGTPTSQLELCVPGSCLLLCVSVPRRCSRT